MSQQIHTLHVGDANSDKYEGYRKYGTHSLPLPKPMQYFIGDSIDNLISYSKYTSVQIEPRTRTYLYHYCCLERRFLETILHSHVTHLPLTQHKECRKKKYEIAINSKEILSLLCAHIFEKW